MIRDTRETIGPDVIIREAGKSDRGTVADFNNRLAEETEGKSLDPAKILPGTSALLGDPGKGRYWLAEIDDTAIGQIGVTYEWSDWRNGRWWWIQSVYVVAEYRREGVFSQLYKHVESLAKADPEACGLRLYVERCNNRAQDTYRSMGMIDSGYQVMESYFNDAGVREC